MKVVGPQVKVTRVLQGKYLIKNLSRPRRPRLMLATMQTLYSCAHVLPYTTNALQPRLDRALESRQCFPKFLPPSRYRLDSAICYVWMVLGSRVGWRHKDERCSKDDRLIPVQQTSLKERKNKTCPKASRGKVQVQAKESQSLCVGNRVLPAWHERYIQASNCLKVPPLDRICRKATLSRISITSYSLRLCTRRDRIQALNRSTWSYIRTCNKFD